MHMRLLGKFLVNAEQQVAQINTGAAAHDAGTVAGLAHALPCSLAAGLAGTFVDASAAMNSHLGL